jgi:hypothetical protein
LKDMQPMIILHIPTKRQILEKWNSLFPDIDGFVRNIQEDFTNENLLYLGTEKVYTLL